tara:strand:+ start:1137 stop:1367 length:231 start_codon:yes stop_codon:yes gene_type:complete
MKKYIPALLLVFSLTFSFTSCREKTEKEEIVEEMKDDGAEMKVKDGGDKIKMETEDKEVKIKTTDDGETKIKTDDN